jgi:MFS transporter, DHA3 family, tetracycline resistance protein
MFTWYASKWDARRLYQLMSGGTSFFFALVFGVNMVYQAQTLGLTPLQLVLVGTTLELAIFLFEVPTGIVADVRSRRLSIIIGYGLIGVGFVIEGAIPSFGAVLLAQLLWGLGYTFTSGATQAWITDEVGEEQVGPVFVRAAQIGNLAGIAGTLLALLLGSLLINLPIILGGLCFIALAVFLIAVMPETGFKPTLSQDRSSWGQMAHTLRGGLWLIRLRPTLLTIFAIGLFIGLYSEGFDRLNTAHLLSFPLPTGLGLQPVVWIGLIGIVGQALSALALRLLEKRLDMTNSRALARASLVINGLLVASLVGFALAGAFWVAVIARWLVAIIRTVQEPVQSTWMNQHIDSEVRATVLSISGQVDAIGQLAGGPPLGWVGSTFGIRAALLASAAILSPVVLLYGRLIRQPGPSVGEPGR